MCVGGGVAIYGFILGGVWEHSAKCEGWEPVLNGGQEPSVRGFSFGTMLFKLHACLG